MARAMSAVSRNVPDGVAGGSDSARAAAEAVLRELAGLGGPPVAPAPTATRAGRPAPEPEGPAVVTRLRLAEARYQALVEQMPVVTFTAALDGGANELYVSPQIEALLGYTQREWLEDPILWYIRLH